MAPPSVSQQSALALATERSNNNVILRTTNNAATDSGSDRSSALTNNSVTRHRPLTDRILVSEHRFTALTQNITHFSPLKFQLDKHNITIERLENEVKKKTTLLQKSAKRQHQSSRQGSNISLHASENSDPESLLAQQQSTKEALESLNAQLLAAKILHIGLTRQVAQYFESRGELQNLLEEIFSGSTPEQISAEIVQVKESYEKYRAAKNELKEVRRYVDIWNDAVEKQVASNAKDVTKSFKKFVPFFNPKPPSYTRIADNHMANARSIVTTLEGIGLLSDIKMDTIADTSSELVIYTARFKDLYNSVTQTLETLHKRSRVLKHKRNQCIEKLFDERCKIFSEELQAHYRSVGESLVNGSGSGSGTGSGTGSGLSLPGLDSDVIAAAMVSFRINGGSGGIHFGGPSNRQHAENGLDSHASEGGCGNSSTMGRSSQELFLEELPPSYFQHEQQDGGPVITIAAATATTGSSTALHRRTFSLGSPAHSSSASSSLSLHSPAPPVIVHTTDSPPDYNVHDERGNCGPVVGVSVAAGPSITTTVAGATEDEDPQFRAYRQRYDTRHRQSSDSRTSRTNTVAMTTTATTAIDMPPGYEETRHHPVVVSPV
ncbi:hypothetical protein BGZ65_003855 [Modicella reniformis]|uniref:Uncharacterized protein n=1 Tax=Modicella reniformis TaxID=1440133 RepID=A0A9P6J5U3_9FUNG|nr:hypothetical protein BGZ65_003855 [Modicella reniformis]